MEDKTGMVLQLRQAGHDIDEIARWMGATPEWVRDILEHPASKQAMEGPAADPDDALLYGPDRIKFVMETMFPKALKVFDKVLDDPGAVTSPQLKAAEWVLSKAAAIQELTKEKEGATVINQFVMNDRAAGALEKLASEWTKGGQWIEALEASLEEMPDGIE